MLKLGFRSWSELQTRLSRDGEMARSLIHRLKRLESRFRPDYKRPEIVINCIGPRGFPQMELNNESNRPAPSSS